LCAARRHNPDRVSTARRVIHKSTTIAAPPRRTCFGDGMNLFKRIFLRVNGIRAAVDAGMTTAEYAVGTVAAVAFAVVLYKIVRSDAVSTTLSAIIKSALHAI
jgi:hypothetical protein